MAIGGLPGAAMRGVQSMPREESRGDAGGSGRRDEEAGGGGGGRWDGKRGMVRAVENWQRSRAKLMAKRSRLGDKFSDAAVNLTRREARHEGLVGSLELLLKAHNRKQEAAGNGNGESQILYLLSCALDPKRGVHQLQHANKKSDDTETMSYYEQLSEFADSLWNSSIDQEDTRIVLVKAAFLYSCLYSYLAIGSLVLKGIEHGPEKDRIEAWRVASASAEARVETMCMGEESVSKQLCNQAIQALVNFTSDGRNTVLREQAALLDEGKLAYHFGFWNCWYVVFQTISTIGYGDITPETEDGRTFLMLYGLLGIGLHGMILIRDAVVINRISDYLNARMDLPYFSERYENVILISSFALGQIILYAAFMGHMEDWSYADSIYYAWVSFTTIGYGDYAPTTRGAYTLDRNGATEYFAAYILIWTMLTCFGLSLLAAFLGAAIDASTLDLKEVLERVMDAAGIEEEEDDSPPASPPSPAAAGTQRPLGRTGTHGRKVVPENYRLKPIYEAEGGGETGK